MSFGQTSIRLLIILLCLTTGMRVAAALAQNDGQPSVEVDTSVLTDLQQNANPDIHSIHGKPIVLKPPRIKSPETSVHQPAAPGRMTGALLTTPVSGGTPEITQFPIKTKVRSESSDPSLPASSRASSSTHAPISKDVASALAGKQKSEAIKIVAPKKPKIVRGAVVADQDNTPSSPKPRAWQSLEDSTQGIIMSKMPEPKPAPVRKSPPAFPIRDDHPPGVPAMPAMPAPSFASVEIPPGATNAENDALLDRMMQMERHQVMAGVEDVVKRTKTPHVIPSSPAPSKQPPMPVPIAPAAQAAQPKADKIEPSAGATQPIMAKTAIAQPALATKPKKAPKASIKSSSEKLASASPAPPDEGPLSINYTASQISINDALQKQIHGKILPLLNKSAQSRVQIQAYASELANDKHTSRERSLARALAVRQYLLSQGIAPEKLDIRAMGAQTESDQMDRVDFVFSPNGGPPG